MMLGKIENFYNRFIKYKQLPTTLPDILRRVADYLEQDYSKNPIHPKHAQLMVRRFSRMDKKKQWEEIKKISSFTGATTKASKSEMTKLYKKLLWRKENLYQV